jgi:hypothetical protein
MTPSRLALRRNVAPVTSSPAIARVGQLGRVDIQVLGRAIDAGHDQGLAKNDDLERLMGQDHLRIIPTRAINPDLVVPDGLKGERDTVRF